MRQLTASQKIAILEDRIAQLEKRASVRDLLNKISKFLSKVGRFRKEAKPIFKRAGTPKSIAKAYLRLKDSSEIRQAQQEIIKEVGHDPVHRIEYIIVSYSKRESSMHKRSFLSTLLFGIGVVAVPVLIIATILDEFEMDIQYYEKYYGKKKASLHKESGFISGIILSISTFIASYFWGGK